MDVFVPEFKYILKSIFLKTERSGNSHAVDYSNWLISKTKKLNDPSSIVNCKYKKIII